MAGLLNDILRSLSGSNYYFEPQIVPMAAPDIYSQYNTKNGAQGALPPAPTAGAGIYFPQEASAPRKMPKGTSQDAYLSGYGNSAPVAASWNAPAQTPMGTPQDVYTGGYGNALNATPLPHPGQDVAATISAAGWNGELPAPALSHPGQKQTPMASIASRFGNSQQLANANPETGIMPTLLADHSTSFPKGGGPFPEGYFPPAPAAPQSGGGWDGNQPNQNGHSGPLGGFFGALESIFNPNYRARMTAASYLQREGLPQGDAMAIAGDPALLRSYLGSRMQANSPQAALDLAYKKAQLQHLQNENNGTKQASYGTSPLIFTDPQGKMHMGQMSNAGGVLIDGEMHPSLPEGWKIGTVSQTGSGGLSPQTLDILAAQYLAGDKSAIQGFSRNATMRAQLANAIAKKANEMGMDGKAIAAEVSAYGGNVAAQRTAGTRAAQVGMAASEANKMADVALEASQAVPRGKFVPWNVAINAVRTGTSSPQMAAFVTATTSLVNAYARAVSPLGAPTDAMRQHAEQMLNTAQSPQAYEAVINQMKKEMEAALNAPAEVSSELKKQITGPSPEAATPATPAAAAPAMGPTATNPKTGERIHWDGKQWVPVQ